MRCGKRALALGVILLYSTFNLSLCVVTMRDISRDVSKEVEEAARIAGGFALADFLDDRVATLTGWVDRHDFPRLRVLLE